jgi:hypothetical protein
MISSKEVKRTFKVVLNSYIAGSYEGQQFNANYYVDLQKFINDEATFDKQYKVYCTFVSKSESIANNQITSTNMYTLAVNFNNNGIQVYNYNMSDNYDFILPIQNITDTGGTVHTFFNLQDINQRPLFIQNVRNLTNINIRVNQINTTASSVFNPTTPDNSKYICILTFVEC